jgi:hypothetical protein
LNNVSNLTAEYCATGKRQLQKTKWVWLHVSA